MKNIQQNTMKKIDILKKKEDKIRIDLDKVRTEIFETGREQFGKELQKYVDKYYYNSSYRKYYHLLRVKREEQSFQFVSFSLQNIDEYNHYDLEIDDVMLFEIFDSNSYDNVKGLNKEVQEITKKEFEKVWGKTSLKIKEFLGID